MSGTRGSGSRFEAFDAVRLFVQGRTPRRARIRASAEAASIIDICQQVEGSPLALQLAAAWTRVLPCEAIAAELRRGTELLHAVDAAHPARHASIEVVFDQSWRLLTRDRARRTVAAVGFPRRVHGRCGARGGAEHRLPVLGALADKSLVRKDGARIFLHPLVQQLASARLSESPAHAATQAAHAAYFHQLLRNCNPGAAAGERAALQTIEVELRELSTRVDLVDRTRPDRCTEAQFSDVLLDHFDYRGRFEEGLALLRTTIESPSAQADDRSCTHCCSARMSHLEYRLNRFADAESTRRERLEATRQ